MNCLIIPNVFLDLFPIEYKGDGVTTIADINGNQVITEDLISWTEFVEELGSVPELREKYLTLWEWIQANINNMIPYEKPELL
jgi:hypothetical protein